MYAALRGNFLHIAVENTAVRTAFRLRRVKNDARVRVVSVALAPVVPPYSFCGVHTVSRRGGGTLI